LKAAPGVPVPPALGPAGLELWNRIWTAGRQWLSLESDYPLVTMLCQAQDEAEELRLLLATGAEDRYYIVANGQKVTSPVVTQLKDLRVQMTAWLASLGYSPSDRARLGLAEVRAADVLDELERRRAERRNAANG
jgi:P27 family predicted phage terminase small subunit